MQKAIPREDTLKSSISQELKKQRFTISEKPLGVLNREKPVWLKFTEEEVKAIIQKLANKGLTSEKIGLVLRDQYGIPKTKLYNIKIKHILEEQNKFQEPTIKNLEDKLQKIISHYKKNKQDKNAERSLIITKAKLKKQQDYQKKREGKQRI